ncbi:J domain-containing protein [Leptodesmis sichuanensis]|uniref:J domain-containing protein n=1 Tax=Leptodesmis sichuanensis TaxID=2906798 RepID=UPI001F2ED825|nr:J domain-containing protein [Leptodesmis sichuanensis]UIE36364.1 J domain-containing protein [Leptodesmis sichuanensis A121]
MNVADCYRVLELRSGASLDDIKVAYRRLARQFHPDMSAGDQRSQDKFIEITAAYKFLLNRINGSEADLWPSSPPPAAKPAKPPRPVSTHTQAVRKAVQIQTDPSLSPLDNELKRTSYHQLQQLLRTQKFPRAIALVEGLARRLPQDLEVMQWQAIVYQQWGRQLVRDRQPDKARLYLKKALQTDPHNRSLWAEVEKDFRSIERHC